MYGPVNSVAPGSVMRSRLVERLLNSRPNLNNGTVAGGLAYGVDQLTRGLNANRAMQAEQAQQQQETDAVAAMVRGMSAQQWSPPTGEQVFKGDAPGAPELTREEMAARAAPAGGYAGAISAVQGLGTAPATRLASKLLMDKSEQDMRRADRNAELMEVYDPKVGGMVYKPRGDVGPGMMSAAPPARFETVQNPYGMGGAAQRNTVTGELSNFQAPPKPAGPGRGVWAHDRENGTVTMVDEATIRANPERYGPQSEAADEKYMSRKRVVGNQEVFEVSYDGGRTWNVEGEPYARSVDPTAALLATMLGGGQGLLDGQGGGSTGAPGPATVPAAAPAAGPVPMPPAAAPSGAVPSMPGAGAPGMPGGAPVQIPGPGAAVPGQSGDLTPENVQATLAAARAKIASNPGSRPMVERMLSERGINPALLGGG